MTRDVPSAATRLAATTRAMSFCSGAAQRSNSSSRTRFGPTVEDDLGAIDGGRNRHRADRHRHVEDDAGGAGALLSA